jgi:hypothetical protein
MLLDYCFKQIIHKARVFIKTTRKINNPFQLKRMNFNSNMLRLEGMLGLDGHMVVPSGSVEVQSSFSLAESRTIFPHTTQPSVLIQPPTVVISSSLDDDDLLDY